MSDRSSAKPGGGRTRISWGPSEKSSWSLNSNSPKVMKSKCISGSQSLFNIKFKFSSYLAEAVPLSFLSRPHRARSRGRWRPRWGWSRRVSWWRASPEGEKSILCKVAWPHIKEKRPKFQFDEYLFLLNSNPVVAVCLKRLWAEWTILYKKR